MGYIHQNIRFLRKRKGGSQKEAASEFKISQNMWSRWESDMIPKSEYLIPLSEYFGVCIDRLFKVDMESEGIRAKQEELPEQERGRLHGMIVKKDMQLEECTAAMEKVIGVLVKVGERLAAQPLIDEKDAGEKANVLAELAELKKLYGGK